MRTGESRSIVGEIAYLDYVALLCFMDAEWTRRKRGGDGSRRSDIFCRNQRSFTSACWKYRQAVKTNYEAFCRANGEESQDELQPHLFNPVFWYPFGHPDELALVLLDDFDPVHFLTLEARTTFEDVCLAFCPQLDSLRPKESRPHFVELHELLGEEGALPVFCKDRPIDEAPIYGPSKHAFQMRTPLATFTRCKLEGLVSNGQALLSQQAVFRAIIDRSEEVLCALRTRVDSDPAVRDLMEEAHLDDVRIALLDLQGSEEIGVLVFSTNLSVSVAIIAAIRSLTWEDALGADASDALREALRRSPAHREAARCNLELLDRPHLKGNVFNKSHVMRWSQTSLSVAPNAFYCREYARCHGMVEAWSVLRVAPGHHGEVEEILKADPRERFTTSRVPQGEGYHRFLLGEGDLVVYDTAAKPASWPPLVPMCQVLARLKDNLLQFGARIGRGRQGRDVVDVQTATSVPIPRVTIEANGQTMDLICRGVSDEHLSPLSSLLPVLRDRLCFPAAYPGGGRCGSGQLDLNKLKQALRAYGVPVSLRRTIGYLYQDFATIIGDPYVFDVALEFYDTFVVLHELLTLRLPETRRREMERQGRDGLGYLDDGRVSQLSLMVEAIHNALTHRLAKSFPELSIRDMGIDFRGCLAQVLTASDATTRCGLGLLRRFAKPEEGACAQRVGAVVRVGVSPGAYCSSMRMGKIDDVTLAFFEMDVPHVLNVATYCDHLHETFHLIWDAVSVNVVGLQSKKVRRVLATRIEEVFVTLMSQMLICPNDPKAFLIYQAISHSKSQMSEGWDRAAGIQQVTELLIRGFLAADAMPPSGRGRWDAQTWIRDGENLAATRERFRAMFTSIGPFYAAYDELAQSGKCAEVDAYIMETFDEVYGGMAKWMPTIWSKAVAVCENYMDVVNPSINGVPRYDLDQIAHDVRVALEEGRPLVRSLYDLENGSGAVDHEDCEPGVDPLLVICEALRQYISSSKEAEGLEVHLHRASKDRTVQYPKRRRKWYSFQVDKGAATMFCPVPVKRRHRLQKQIVLLKTLWDISSSLRARRLERILRENFPPGNVAIKAGTGH